MKPKTSQIIFGAVVAASAGLANASEFQSPVRITTSPNRTHLISVPTEGCVINLPAQPERIVVGRKDVFNLETVGSDIVLSPAVMGESTSLFAYALGRRFSFRLSSAGKGASVYLVDDEPKPGPRRLESKTHE